MTSKSVLRIKHNDRHIVSFSFVQTSKMPPPLPDHGWDLWQYNEKNTLFSPMRRLIFSPNQLSSMEVNSSSQFLLHTYRWFFLNLMNLVRRESLILTLANELLLRIIDLKYISGRWPNWRVLFEGYKLPVQFKKKLRCFSHSIFRLKKEKLFDSFDLEIGASKFLMNLKFPLSLRFYFRHLRTLRTHSQCK